MAKPNRKSTLLFSHHAISASRAKPESARSRMRTFGQQLADAGDDPRDLFDAAGARIDVGRAQFGGQQMPAAEHVKRQITVVVVIAVEAALLLRPV